MNGGVKEEHWNIREMCVTIRNKSVLQSGIAVQPSQFFGLLVNFE